MKSNASFVLLILAFLAGPIHAAPLPKNQIAGDAKWLLHLDLQNLRQTQLGEFLSKSLLEKVAGDLKAKAGVDVAALLQQVSSISAYGTDFAKRPEANGVLLVQMDAEAQKILEGFLAAHMLADNQGAMKKEQQGASVLYSLKDELFLAIHPKHLVVVGKSQSQLDKARAVLGGKAPNLSASGSFSEYPAAPDAFFFLALAEGFNENTAIPPQAKVLQMADGGRVIVGEKSEKLFLDLALKAKNSEVGEQILQVIEGIRAMVSLGQPDNQDLQELARSIKVANRGKMVTVNAEFPVGPVLKKLSDKITEKHGGVGGQPKAKHEAEPKRDPSAASEKKAE